MKNGKATKCELQMWACPKQTMQFLYVTKTKLTKLHVGEVNQHSCNQTWVKAHLKVLLKRIKHKHKPFYLDCESA